MELNKRTTTELNGFLETFRLYPVADEWREELHNYFIKGWPPGSFHAALFADDLTAAVFKSHSSNKWGQIREFVKWVFANAPAGSVGSYENVKEWLDKPEEERKIICINKGWMLTEEELAWKLLEEA